MYFVAEYMRSSEVSILEYCTRKCNPYTPSVLGVLYVRKSFNECCVYS